MGQRRDTSIEAEHFRFDVLRSLTGSQRVQMAAEMTDEVNQICRDGIADRHPEYSVDQVQIAFVRLLLGDDLFMAACPGAELLSP
jgi:hypothetical protein